MDRVYNSNVVTFAMCDTWADRIILDIMDFDFILGMVIMSLKKPCLIQILSSKLMVEFVY